MNHRDDEPPLPTFLIVGAAKSGTTTLIHSLSAHTEIHAPTDELHFFSRRYHEGLAAYRADFCGWQGEHIIGETSPEYMYQAEVAPRIISSIPDVKLVAILRNPIERAYSQYWHNRTRGHEPMEFAASLDAEPDRRTDPDPRQAALHAYVGRSMYAEQIERLYELVGPARVHVMLTESLRSDRDSTLTNVLEFLGAESTDAQDLPRLEKNRFVTFRSQRARGLIRRLPPAPRKLAGRANIRYTNYPPMEDATRRRLEELFAEPNERLAMLTGLELDAWTPA